MKHLPKILTIVFLVVFIFQLAALLFLALSPNDSQAADIKFTPQVQIGDYAFNAKDASTGNIARYVRALYKYAIGIVGILAAVVLMIGGVMWIVAGGSATAIGEAKAWIGASLTGLLIALASYLILATVNPALVNLKTSQITTIAGVKYCCDPTKGTVQPTITTVNNQQQSNCPSGSTPFGSGTANCKKYDDTYQVIKSNINCCQFITTTPALIRLSSCEDGENYTIDTCKNNAKWFEGSTFYTGYNCQGNYCVQN
ncbi:MAG: hypothetical protein Q8O93_04850 [bacterium]|nr:hypothetical protein [bacterium]